MNYIEPDTGEYVTAYLFVATMPYSQMVYVEAAASMNEKAWLSCHVNMFRFFGGTAVKIDCDNLKTGVISHPKRVEIILNEVYLSLGDIPLSSCPQVSKNRNRNLRKLYDSKKLKRLVDEIEA